MSRRRGTAAHATRQPVVVFVGEDRNDRKSLSVLLEDLCPAMRGRIVEINDPARLKSATGKTLQERVKAVKRKAQARALRENSDLACVFIHEDLDDTDSQERLKIQQRVQAALDQAFDSAHYAMPAWEIEAWLLLFPDAIERHVTGWKVPRQLRSVDTGVIQDPKAKLINITGHHRRYRESDAPDVFERAVTMGLLASPSGTNRSWSQFCADALDCGSQHLR